MGMSVVYRARHLSLDSRTRPEGGGAEAVGRRALPRAGRAGVAARGTGRAPNVIPVHHAGEERRLYLAMRLVDGVDLRRLVEASGPLDPAHAVRVLAGIAAGLDAAHAGAWSIETSKPANVLVERDGDSERVFLTDFGISRLAGSEESLTATGEFFGSVDYVAPEQIEGDRSTPVPTSTRSAAFFTFCSGEPPFPRDTELAKLFAHANASRPRPSESTPGLPAAIDDVVAKAMARRPEERYGSAGELVAEAAAALGSPRRRWRHAGGPTPPPFAPPPTGPDATAATVEPGAACRSRSGHCRRSPRPRPAESSRSQAGTARTDSRPPARSRGSARRSRSERIQSGSRWVGQGLGGERRRRRPSRSRHRAGRAADPHRGPARLRWGRLRLGLGRRQTR